MTTAIVSDENICIDYGMTKLMISATVITAGNLNEYKNAAGRLHENFI